MAEPPPPFGDLTASIVYGDSGVGGWPLEGRVEVVSALEPTWTADLSEAALQAAEDVWQTRKEARGVSAEEGVAIARVAFDHAAGEFGFVIEWEDAEWSSEIDGHVVQVTAPMRRTT